MYKGSQIDITEKPLTCYTAIALACITAAISLCMPCAAQQVPMFFHQLTTESGLTSQSENNFIYKDRQGFIWVGSLSGLNRFDGRMVRQYLPSAKSEYALSNSFIQSDFFEDKQGNLWFATYNSIQRYDRKHDRFDRYKAVHDGDTLNSNYGLLMLDSTREQIYFRVDTLLFEMSATKAGKPNLVGIFPELSSYTSIIPGNPDKILLPLGHGLAVANLPKDDEKGRRVKGTLTIKGFDVSRVIMDGHQIAWVCTDRGLLRYDADTHNYQRVLPGKFGEQVSHIIDVAALGKDSLLVATRRSGIFVLQKSTLKYVGQIYAIEGNTLQPIKPSITNIHLDYDNNFWISTSENGLLFSNFHKLKFKPGTSGHFSLRNITNIAADGLGRFWYVADGQLVALTPEGTVVAGTEWLSRQGSPLLKNVIFHVMADDKNRIWVCSDLGVFVIEQSGNAKFSIRQVNDADGPVYGIHAKQLASNGQIIIATNANGVCEVVQRGNQLGLNQLKPFPKSAGYTIVHEDGKGRVFICREMTHIEVCSVQNRTLVINQTIPFEGEINYFLEDPQQGATWVCTNQGLMLLDETSSGLKLKPIEALSNLNILSAQFSRKGELWMSSNKGIIKLGPKEAGNMRFFSSADGLRSTSYSQGACLKWPDGRLMFGGVGGIDLFEPSSIVDLKTNARPVLTNIWINDLIPVQPLQNITDGATNISQLGQINLSARENTISFEFAALEYSDPKSTQLKYFLKGVDNDTVLLKAGERGFARYSSLPAGKHSFVLRACNSDGVWGEPVEVLQINVEAPFYKRWQTYLLAAIVVSGTVWYLAKQKIKREQIEGALKTRAAENKLAALTSQMSPHFVFNCLQTVNAFIIKKDYFGAMGYVNQFAKLMRTTLEYSRLQSIPLEDELKMLELYLAIEQKRFETPFEYYVESDDALEELNVVVPPMLLQPFVENAIKHGVFHRKNEPTYIKVQFLKRGNTMVCAVEDNGVGREAAAAINAQQGRKHVSRGTGIVQERLEVMQQRQPGEYSVTTIDLVNDDGTAAGTRVEVRLPIP